MKKPLPSVIYSASLLFSAWSLAGSNPFAPTSQANAPLGESKIVGGVQAEQANWPWMTAFVVTFEEFATSLKVDDVSYNTDSFTFGPGGEASGQIIDCGIGDVTCADASDKICLIERGEINFSAKANNCEMAGGVGVIIYNNVAGLISGTLGDNFSGTIPVVAINQDDGLAIQEQLRVNPILIASLTVAATAELQQDASCGATFLGDKWVLTAAHCVDSPNARLFKMNVGEYDLSDGAENAIGIANIYTHPEYDADSFDNDVAIVELLESVNIPGVQIAEPSLTNLLAIENSLATVAGWGGRLGYGPGEGPTADFPDILHQVDLRLSTNEECREAFSSSLNQAPQDVGVTDNMICAAAAQGGKGSCQGDSGGPLIVNTASGPQQVGIVSWGIGCAEEGLPGVYTRVPEFKAWLSTISKGIAITPRYDFPLALQGETQNSELRVSNNSEFPVALTFSIDGSADFTVDGSNCGSLTPQASCQITVSHAPNTGGKTSAQVIISSDNPAVLLSKALVLGNTVAKADELSGIAGEASQRIVWFSGGDLSWVISDLEGIESGAIGDLQQSILTAKIEGEGQLEFDWSVSSEENTDNPEEPFDTLSLYINGQLIDFISGEVAFIPYPIIELAEGSNIITWIYSKDLNTTAGDDKGKVRNVTFTPAVVELPPTPAPPPAPASENPSAGGGSLFWLSWGLLVSLLLRRRQTHWAP